MATYRTVDVDGPTSRIISPILVTNVGTDDEVNLSKLYDQGKGMGSGSALQEHPASVTSKAGTETWQDLLQARIVPESSSVGAVAETRNLREIYHDVHKPTITFPKTMHSIVSHRVLGFATVGDGRRCQSDTETSGEEDHGDEECDTGIKVAAAPRNLRRIIKSDGRYPYLKSPCLSKGAHSTVGSAIGGTSDSSSGGLEHKSLMETVIRNPASSAEYSPRSPGFGRATLDPDSRGSRLYVLGEDGIELYTVSPIPFNLLKTRRLTTPSVPSTNSLQNATSPLFRKSCQALLQEARRKFLQSLSTRGNQRSKKQYSQISEESYESYEEQEIKLGGVHQEDKIILNWLDGIPMPKRSTTHHNIAEPVETLKIWKETSPFTFGRMKPSTSSPNTNILRDITNLRRPGYLNHNSFFKEANTYDQAKTNLEEQTTEKALKRSSPPPHLGCTRESFTGASPLQSLFEPDGPPYLFEAQRDTAAGNSSLEGSPSPIQPSSGRNNAVNPVAAQPCSRIADGLAEASRKPTRVLSAVDRYYDLTSALRPFTPDQNHARATHFASALALLEGRAPRTICFPLEVIGPPTVPRADDVHAETFGHCIQCPEPLRWLNFEHVISRIEAMAAYWTADTMEE